LKPGTNLENSADMVSRGRSFRPVGELNNDAKLTEREVLAIRQAATEGAKNRGQAAFYGVSESLISMIVNRKVWRHV
jgi:hypothetical protein